MSRVIALFVAMLATTAWSVAGNEKGQKMDELLKIYNKHQIFNGSVLVAQHGKVVYKGGHGFADFEWEVPNEANTRHRIGSVTKQFTAVLILKLVEAGKLSLDDTVSSILSDYPKETGEKITVHHLLRHTSGIPNYTNRQWFEKYSMIAKTPTDFLEYFKDLPLDFEPGEKYKYSNSGYFLLGVIIEKVSGKSYEKMLREDLLDPLGMHDTGYDNNQPLIVRRARGYELGPGGFVNSNFIHMSLPYAAGSMYSTVEDLFLWDRALVAGKVLSAEMTEKMFTAGKNDYGYGWIIQQKPLPGQDEKNPFIWHGGGINGFNAMYVRYPSEGIVIALLNNTGSTNLRQVMGDMVKILYDQDVEPPKQPAYIPLGQHMGESTFAAKCKEIIANRDKYEISEVRINGLGYYLMGQGQLEEALALFEFNVQAFPEAYNTHDSLGECLAQMGKKERAIASYQKSYDLNNDNTNALKVIEKLKAE